MSPITRKNKRLAFMFKFISIILTITPVAVYVVLGFLRGSITSQMTLGLMLMLALMLTAINVIMKIKLRSTLWFVLIGIYLCVNNIIPLLLLLAFTTIFDELLITPLYHRYKNRFIINREIDRRQNG